ncbi:hypothetical protein LMG27174_03461 [Paraburkholderia rhynchosiae]|uniref:Uncharacterized protein n=1 Tax=Paraburkholderia rhynchosiae TaxID=487049 RepID=A0A6J5BAX0_9BURK|nr:hypothetical protein LMG27174_03461 [Paraburkholderia rhynchosiae]
MIVLLNTDFNVPSGLRAATVGFALTLCVSSVGAVPACPKVITTPAGSAFDMASLISDNGSPEAALNRLRSVLSKLAWGARCNMLRDVAACDETVELAKRAVVALEACAVPTSGKRAQRSESKKTEVDASPHE